jgi:hypothetical protein
MSEIPATWSAWDTATQIDLIPPHTQTDTTTQKEATT